MISSFDLRRSPDDEQANSQRFLLRVWIVASVVAAAVSLLVVWQLGRSIGFDTLNYEYSTGFQQLHGFGSAFNLAGQLQTYLQPPLSLFYYLLIRHLSPLEANLAIALFESLAVGLLATLVTDISYIFADPKLRQHS